MDNMTALVSCFARAYHCRNSNLPVFVDPVAEQMLTAEEYDTISRNMAQGIRYFAPGFKGTPEEALTVYELDRPEMIADRWKRIARAGLEPACHVEGIGCDLSRPSWKEKLIQAGFDAKKISFGTLLGISYYLSKQDFKNLAAAIASISCEGASICFDYPVSEAGAESQRNSELAAAAGEMMKAKYSYEEMEALLSNVGFLIYEHMDAGEATSAFLKESGMTAPTGVGYCLAVRKG